MTLAAGSGYGLGAPAVHTLTITDDDTPQASFATAAATVAENVGTRNVTVRLSPAPVANVTVSYGLSGTAGRGSDYAISGVTSNSGTVVVGTSGSTVIPVVVTNDGVNENSETVVLTLAAGSGYGLGAPAVHTLTITDDDTPQAVPRLSFEDASYRVGEGAGTVGVTVKADPAPSSALTVKLSHMAGSATGADYVAPGATFTFPAGTTSHTIEVTITDDSAVEDDEEFTLTLGAASDSSYTLGSPTQATVSIADNDAAMLLALSKSSTATLSVDLSESRHDPNSGLERPAHGQEVAYSVSLESRPSGVVTVEITVPAGVEVSAAGGLFLDSGDTLKPKLFFLPTDWDEPQRVTVRVLEDGWTSRSDDDDMGTLTHAATGGGYDSVTGEVTVHIDGTEWPESWTDFLSLMHYRGGAVLPEGGHGAHFAVTRSRTYTGDPDMFDPDAWVPIPDAWGFQVCFEGAADPAKRSAVLGVDYRVRDRSNRPLAMDPNQSNCSLHNSVTGGTGLKAGQDRAHFYIEIIDDAHEDSGEQFVVVVKDPVGTSRHRSGMHTFVYTITNHDTVTLPAASASVVARSAGAVEGEAAEFAVVVNPPPAQGETAAVTIDVVGAAGHLADGQAGRRTVTVDHTGIAVLRIATVDDTAREPEAAVTAKLAPGGGYRLGSSGAATVTIADNDPAGDAPTVGIAAVAGIVEGGVAVFTLTADPAPTQPLKVEVSVTAEGDWGIDAGTRTVTIPVSGTSTMRLQTRNDDDDEPDGAVIAAIEAAYHYDTAAAAGAATVAVADNDEPAALVSISDATASETDRIINFTVTLDRAVGHRVTVSYVTADSSPLSAVADSDYASSVWHVHIPAGETTQTIPVYILQDSIDEGPETFQIRITHVTGGRARIHPDQHTATGTITDNTGRQTQPDAVSDGADTTDDPDPNQDDPQPDAGTDGADPVDDQDPQPDAGTDGADPVDDQDPQPDGGGNDTGGSGPSAEKIAACVTDGLLGLVRDYYDANRDRPPNYGQNWERVLIAFGDIQDSGLLPYTAFEAGQSEQVWGGWRPIREALQCLER